MPVIRVAAEYRLVDTVTGRDLWKYSASGVYDPMVTSSAGGPVHVLVKDLRVPARFLTRKAVTSTVGGLPYGPYH